VRLDAQGWRRGKLAAANRTVEGSLFPNASTHRLAIRLVIALVLAAAGCRSSPSGSSPSASAAPLTCGDDESCTAAATAAAQHSLLQARRAAERAVRGQNTRHEVDEWGRCAAFASQAMGAPGSLGFDAATLNTSCTDEFLRLALHEGLRWSIGARRVGDLEVEVELRGLSSYLPKSVAITRASDVSMEMIGGKRNARAGYGVPVVVHSPVCHSEPVCKLVPREGIFRGATAWIETAPTEAGQALQEDDVRVRLVVGDPIRETLLRAGEHRYALALDTSAPFAMLANSSSLKRLGFYGLIGGNEIGRRAGVYLLEDYDPHKRPIVMIHGLAASPLNWSRVSNAIWGDPVLRGRFQVWHVIYQTDAPLMILRSHIQAYLDKTWSIVDPEGDDPARKGVVLIGHSMGGVIARLLCVESGDVMWNAAFTLPPGQLPLKPDDAATIEKLLLIHPYPGVTRAIFLATPHQGSPSADAWYGRLFRKIIGKNVPEMQMLQRLAREHPEIVTDDVREMYAQADVNSIATLQAAQPVRAASQTLLPQAGIRYNTIAGSLTGEQPPGDGFVPLDSAKIAGAESTLVIRYGHQIYESDEAVEEVLRILREDAADADSNSNQPGK
jgi:pimeloyl-ACP methyl ester carboxylesterase